MVKTRPVGVKSVNPPFKKKALDGLNFIAKAMEGKNIVKRDELRLKCISELTHSDIKTNLIL